MHGREFLRVAVVLLDEEDEAFNRASIGRSYYAAFLEARSFCEQYLGFARSGSGGEHQVVPRLIAPMDPFLADGVRILRSRRNVADYDIHLSAASVSRSAASDALAMAQSVVEALDALAERIEREKAEVEDDSLSP